MSLPRIDVHSATLHVRKAEVWQAVRWYAHRLAHSDHTVLGRVLGTEPRSGFAVAEEVESERLVLTGRHRFARYRLVFNLSAESNTATRLSIASYAAFPGARGRLYRGLVVGTRGHVLAVRHMLRTIQRRVGT